MDDERVSPYWIVLFESNQHRDEIKKQLSNAGIDTRRWWPMPLSQMPAFRHEEDANIDESNSSYLASTTLGLPFHLGLNNRDLMRSAPNWLNF
jgi:dTDP-4-amino-4,6-dideoxygalactose transaminase